MEERRSRRSPTWSVLAVVVVAFAASAAAQERAPEPAESHFLAAERIAEVVTLTTGVPISPLVGVSGLGAYRWWRTPEARRAELPWYARPWYWASGLLLAALFAVNTTLGGLLPGLEKPMDFVEHYENQVSALVASPIVVFEVLRIADSLPVFTAGSAVLPHGALTAAGVATVAALPAPVAWLAKLGTAALVLAAFAVVFLAFHAIQVLITLSPSAVLDLLLRLFRLSMLSLVAMAALVHPYVGAAIGILVLAGAMLVAGWAFRLSVFGWVFAGDFVRRRRAAEGEPAVAFASRHLAGPAPRAFGVVAVDAEGVRRFTWRPWFVFARRGVAIGDPVAVRRGALSPTLVAMGGVREPVVVRFPPRFHGVEDVLGRRLGAVEVVDSRLARGLEAAWRWLRETVRGDGGAELAG